MKLQIHTYLLILFCILIAACGAKMNTQEDVSGLSWDEIESRAEGSTVNLMMWQGDPNINAYMSNYVVPKVKERYNINLEIASGQGNTIVSILMTEIQAGKENSELDMMWINGETFYQLRQVDALFGPFTDRLPNAQYINFENPFISFDFQQRIDGYEMPWGNVQFTLIYDRSRVEQPPRTMQQLENYVKEHPGKFTIPTEFTGMTFLKSLLIGIAGKGTLDGPFDEEKYEKYSAELWEYINHIKSYFWKEGDTFPSSLSAMHQMFASGELNFTMSNNDAEVDNKVLEGFFPESARAYVLESGTIQNSHYMGIVDHSNNKAAAMVVSNFLISPEAQYRKLNPDVWGDGSVLASDKLPEEWQQKFMNVPNREYAPPRSTINEHALRELAPEYMIRLYEDFRTEVIQR